jgi:hypothetical protein
MICCLLINKDIKKKFTTENTDKHGVKIHENFRDLREIRGKKIKQGYIIIVNIIII